MTELTVPVSTVPVSSDPVRSDPVRIATVGTSSIVDRFAAAAAPVAGLEIVCCHSRDAGRAAETAARLGVDRSSSDWDDLLADPEVDALYLATPNLVHGPQAAQAITAGKHVLLEKSATPTADEWQQLLDLAAAHGVVVVEEMRPAHDPGTAEILRLVDTLGPIRRVRFDYTQRSSRYDLVLAGEPVAIFDPELAGGSFYDLGVYAVSQLVQVFGEPLEVLTTAEVELPTGADGLGVVLALYPGFVAEVGHSKITRPGAGSEVQGELATLTIDRIDDPRTLTVTALDGSLTTLEVPKTGDNMTSMLEAFVRFVTGVDDPTPDQERTLGTLRFMDEARRVRRRTRDRGVGDRPPADAAP